MPKQLSERKIFEKGRFIIKDINLVFDNGEKVTYQIWEKADTAMIVPMLPDGKILFIREYQMGLNREMICLPKGRIEQNEKSREIANKELQEEIGYRAKTLQKIAVLSAIDGYIRSKTHVYLATNLEKSKLTGDEKWQLEVFPYPLAKFEKLIDEKKLTEARMISALYETRRFLKRKK